MKVSQIVNTIETYNKYKAKLQKDILDYQEFKIFDNDRAKTEEMQIIIEQDKKELGQFLNMEV